MGCLSTVELLSRVVGVGLRLSESLSSLPGCAAPHFAAVYLRGAYFKAAAAFVFSVSSKLCFTCARHCQHSVCAE